MDEPPKTEGRLKLRDVNPYLICVLCGGYFVDAASIIECLHTFCWTCIAKYLEKNKFCPICDVQAYKTDPKLSIRLDDTIQRLTYKMVPGLYANEMQRRREFYMDSEPPPAVGLHSPSFFYAPDDSISLSLEYYEPGTNNNDEKCNLEDQDSLKMKIQIPYKRYLQCPAAVTINHLKKFVRMKYGLASEQMVDIIYEEECLPENFSLMDVAYTFTWDRATPMRFSYRILEKSAVSAETQNDVISTQGYSAPEKNDWPQRTSTAGSDESATNTGNERQLRGQVFSKRKSDSGNESNETSYKEDDEEDLDDVSLVKRLRVSARLNKMEKEVSKPRRRSRSSPRKTNKRRKIIESDEEEIIDTPETSPEYTSPVSFNEDSLDDYAKYEDDIEEITDDLDEEDEDRLRISPMEENTGKESEEVTSQEGSVNNDVEELEEISGDKGESLKNVDSYSYKVKRKSKKGKHHHHHKHDRVKAPSATILKSDDADIMKMKFKLNPVPSDKYHKHSNNKPKLIGEVIPITNNSLLNSSCSSNSVDPSQNENKKQTSSKNINGNDVSSTSSIGKSDALGNNEISTTNDKEKQCFNVFSNDDDSQNSQQSEDNAGVNRAKSVINEDPECMIEEETIFEVDKRTEPKVCNENKKQVTSSKDKITQMRAIRKTVTSKPSPSALIFTNSDSNSSRSMSPLLHPPSSITVSKITAEEKRKLDEDKLNNYPDSNSADSLRPSLEILLVNGPTPMQNKLREENKTDVVKKKPDSTKLCQSPLIRLQKMSANLTQSVTFTTHSVNSSKPNQSFSSKSSSQNNSEFRTLPGNLEISVQKENTAPKRVESRKLNDDEKKSLEDAGALDLSGKSSRSSSSSSSFGSDHSNSPSPNGSKSTTVPYPQRQQVNKVSSPTVSSKSNSENGNKTLPVSMQNLAILSSAAAHIQSQITQGNTKLYNGNAKTTFKPVSTVSRNPSLSSTVQKQINNTSQLSLKISKHQPRSTSGSSTNLSNGDSTLGKTDALTVRSKTIGIPKLNEIDKKQFFKNMPSNGPITSKPGPNQFVRHISDPSGMIYSRQQHAINSVTSSQSSNQTVKKYANGRLSSPPAAIPIASMLRPGSIPRDIEKVAAGLQIKASGTAAFASVK